MGKETILLAEDDPNDVELIIAALAEHNIANPIVVTRDGAECLEYLHRQGSYENRDRGNPLLILLDLKMPKVDGFEVLQKVKNDPELKTIPVIILTSSKQEQDIVRSYDLGVNAFMVKPVEFDNFVKVIKDMSLFWLLINVPPPPKE